MAWLAVMSGAATAHATAEAAHPSSHTHDHAPHAAEHDAFPTEEAAANDASHVDTCQQGHCGHGHTTGVLAANRAFNQADALTAAPSSHASWVSSPITANIERPKWLVTTPAVVSLLS